MNDLHAIAYVLRLSQTHTIVATEGPKGSSTFFCKGGFLCSDHDLVDVQCIVISHKIYMTSTQSPLPDKSYIGPHNNLFSQQVDLDLALVF
ncbi:hypothetical protein Syun_024272 [Stephania yunnanensis]|uniref:Uncharacterized protein n=1 Tax=Stephania yunnanensis TaxID=152371 RepID=A0AAP0I425_9MAGN